MSGERPMQSVSWAVRRLIDPTRRPLRTTGYLVLGMHRSGTSCLTGLLETCGLWVGDVSRKARFNLKGNRESASIRQVSIDILRNAGGTWRKIPEIDFSRVDPRPVRAALEPYRHHPRWLAKDPRMVLTLPAWLPHVPRHRLVGTFRHPIAVARSLNARNDNMSIEQGMDLWVEYNRVIVALHRRGGFPVMNFDLDAAAYLRQFRSLCDELDLSVDVRAAEEFYERDLVHQDAADLGAPTGEAAELYDYLRAHAVAPRAPAAVVQVPVPGSGALR